LKFNDKLNINAVADQLIEDLGRRISAISNEAREGVFFFQRLSVLLQRFNAILVLDSFIYNRRIGPRWSFE